MKYIITEEQSIVLRVRRSIDQDYDLIKESVVEGMEMFLCDYDTLNDFYEFSCQNSAMTYLFFYFDNQYQEGYQKMEDYMTEYIKENFGEMIVKYWNDNRDDC
jgi:hypothetical protein